MSKSPSKPDAEAADEITVLFSDLDIEVRDPDSGQPAALTVREFRFLEGLGAQATARELIAALAALAEGAGDDAEPGPAELDAIIGAHSDAWIALIAVATGRPASWLSRLSDRDGRTLTGAMWSTNAPFFWQRAYEQAVGKAEVAKLCRLLRSSTRLSGRGTEAETATEASQTA